jgi:hypothetical protein
MTFGKLLDVLSIAFRFPVSERDYHDIVCLLRDYDDSGRTSVDEERSELERRGWPVTYHPCDHMENVRWGMVFGSEDNARIREMLL